MTDNSDYNKPRTDLFELLPEVNQSDVNKSVFENIFNRYLTKKDLKIVDGFIGIGNPGALINRQIQEETPNRQAYQLQPILFNQIGDIDHMATYVDIINELERLGVDKNRLELWGNAEVFNWVPPIDIDKLINYRDYYWYDADDLTSLPQYLTIKNICALAESRLAAYELTITNFGEFHDIEAIGIGTGSPIVDSSFSITGDISEVFVNGFVFLVSESANVNINDKFYTTESSIYDSLSNLTTIFVQQAITQLLPVDGVISLTEGLSIYQAARDCLCGGSTGWDQSQWDDNQTVGAIIWNEDLLTAITWATEAEWLLANGVGSPAAPELYDLWYDTSSDELKQWGGGSPLSWTVVRGAFSSIVAATKGTNLWDLTRGCTFPTNQWVEQNRWIHKTYVPNFTVAKQAQIPIIEYDPFVELNEWIELAHTWQYRPSASSVFEDTTAKPELIEVVQVPISLIDDAGESLELEYEYGDQSSTFVEGYQFKIEGSSNYDATYTVASAYYQLDVGSGRYRTVINVAEDIVSVPAGSPPTLGYVKPFETSQGDTYQQFHDHWLYIGMSDTFATMNQCENPFAEVDVTSTPTYEVQSGSPLMDDAVLSQYYYISNFYAQIFSVNTGTVSNFPLIPSLQDISLVGTGDIRVYVDTIRQYGNYLENIFRWEVISSVTGPGGSFTIKGDQTSWLDGSYASGSPLVTSIEIVDSVLVGSPISTSTYTVTFGSVSYSSVFNETTFSVDETVQFYDSSARVQFVVVSDTVVCISLDTAIPILSECRIEVGSAAIYDIGREIAPVRTIADNATFASQGTEEVSLVRYKKSEQVKVFTNQYPLFNIFKVDGTGTNKANQIFGFRESAEYPVNSNIGKRIVELETGRNYQFEQYLIEQDNDSMFAYRDIDRLDLIDDDDVKYWVDTTDNSIYVWDGNTWCDKIQTDGYCVKPISGTMEPEAPWNTIVGMIWYNTNEKALYQSDGTGVGSFITPLTAFIQEVDESMQTIWKGGLNSEEYVPSYVDGDRNPIAIGNPAGDWEIPDQLYFNYAHENKKYITSAEILTHFTTIIEAQETFPGIAGSVSQSFHLLEDVNYGVGGTIKEHNDSYDTMLSSIFVNNITPLGLLEFAQNQYEASLTTLQELFRKDATTYLTDTSIDSLINIGQTVADEIINQYELNDNTSLIYGDSPTYIAETDTGIKNWIATLPFFKLAFPVQPELHIDRDVDLVSVLHHDGHRSSISIQASEVEAINQQTIAVIDDRYGGPFGLSSTSAPPTTYSQLLTDFGTITAETGWYWYHTPTVGANVLYRFSVISILAATPSVSNEDGVLWYDSGTDTLRVKSGLLWVPITSIGDEIITSSWHVIDINEIVGEIIYEAETRLYAAVPAFGELAFDVSQLSSEQALYDSLLQLEFAQFLAERQITTPFVNTSSYVATDPFTWNYKNSMITEAISNLGSAPLNVDRTTLPSGGAWQDLYEKTYGTPFPHLEPWVLQGYSSQPSWWADTYEQTDGSRKWVYFHDALEIDSVDVSAETISVVGDWTKLFPVGTDFNVINGGSPIPGNNWGPLTTITVTYDITANRTEIGIAPSDVIASVVNGSITSTTGTSMGMWENIRTGIIPAGELRPDDIISDGTNGTITPYIATFSFFSVNIDNVTVDTLYAPDDLFPPYWNHVPFYGVTTFVRTTIGDISYVVNPNFDYNYGDAGTVEWNWTASSQYLYDQLAVAFKMQPVRFMHYTFGTEFFTVAGLQVDQRTCKVYSHADAVFHGDIVNTNETVSINGLNQWYTNYGRYTGLDISFSDFRRTWVNWVAPLSYQMASFVDTNSADIINSNFDINSKDYGILFKRSPGITDKWVDSFEAIITYVPPARIAYDVASEWKFSMTTASPTGRALAYYAVRNYEFTFAEGTNIGTIYQYPIALVNATRDLVYITGNKIDLLPSGRQFVISGSTGNNGTYTVDTTTYDLDTDQTIIVTIEDIINPLSDGNLRIIYRTLPWVTGDEVYMSSTMNLPLEFDGSAAYYIIQDSTSSFRLAETASDALAGISIDITTIGTGVHYVGQLKSTFNALGGSKVWRHYELDTGLIKLFIPPEPIQGIQKVIDLVDGYEAYAEETGVVFNDNNGFEYDEATGRAVTWQLEIERFIDWTTIQRAIKYSQPDQFITEADVSTNQITFPEDQPTWETGQKVSFQVFQGTTPTPLLRNIAYYIIRESADVFQLALTSYDADKGIAIDLTSAGTGTLYVQKFNQRDVFPSQRINPFRNNLWVSHEQGIVSDIKNGPYKDIRIEQTIYDQYGRSLDSSDLTILRQDTISKISALSEIVNDVQDDFLSQDDAYNFLHIGGAHIFLDGYEHVLMFNNYSIEGFLIYDPFLGLSQSKFDVRFERQPEFTLRPNVGGYVISEKDLITNYEKSVTDMQRYYDTFQLPESSDIALYSRKLLGYDRLNTYLDQISINDKSSFLFWRGMIQNKGSVNSVKAFINSRRFVDAKVDEYWAYKIADFGDSREQEYLPFKLYTTDSQKTEFKVQFLTSATDEPAEGFIGVLLTDKDRWFEQPLQNQKLVNNTEMYFDAELTTVDDTPTIDSVG